MVRQFGSRAAMNTPIQGTAADIMKIAMIRVYKQLKDRNLKSKIVLQVHDEMMIEAEVSEIEEVREILQNCMESAIDLKVPLIAELSKAENWYDCKWLHYKIIWTNYNISWKSMTINKYIKIV